MSRMFLQREKNKTFEPPTSNQSGQGALKLTLKEGVAFVSVADCHHSKFDCIQNQFKGETMSMLRQNLDIKHRSTSNANIDVMQASFFNITKTFHLV